MQISYFTGAVIQLVIDLILILAIIVTLYLVISLIIKVRKDKKVDKMKSIKKLILYTFIIELLLLSVNLFFKYDPFNIVEDDLGETYIFETE